MIRHRKLFYLVFLTLAYAIWCRTLAADDNLQDYVVTIPGCPFAAHPVAVRAKSRLEALMKLHATVWTAKEWADAQPGLKDFKACGVPNPQPEKRR